MEVRALLDTREAFKLFTDFNGCPSVADDLNR